MENEAISHSLDTISSPRDEVKQLRSPQKEIFTEPSLAIMKQLPEEIIEQ